MILNLFTVLIGISLILIIIGLVKHTESAQALIGFFFLFLLSFIVMQGNLQYEIGANVTSSYYYDVNGTLSDTTQIINNVYDNFDDATSFKMGLYLTIVSVVGFAGVLLGLRNTNWRQE